MSDNNDQATQPNDNLQALRQLLDQRDQMTFDSDIAISTLLAPTVLAAVAILLKVKISDLHWTDVGQESEHVVINIHLEYSMTNDSPFLVGGRQTSPGRRAKEIIFAVPFHLAFSSVEEIATYLYESAEESFERNNQLAQQEIFEFDVGGLTAEQQLQMLYFEQNHGTLQ